MRDRSSAPLSVLSGGMCLVLCGCPAAEPSIEQGGNSRDGRYIIDAPTEVLVAGATARFVILDWEVAERQSAAPLTDVGSSDEQVARVLTVAKEFITLEARAPGEATISFTGQADEASVRDAFTVEVVEPQSLTLKHCAAASSGEPRYARGVLARVPFTFDTRAQGAGVFPVTIDPDGAAEVDASASSETEFLLTIAADAPDEITLTPTLAQTPTPRRLKTIPYEEVDEIAIVTERPQFYIGGEARVGLRLLAGDRQVCSLPRHEWMVRTPGVCEVGGPDRDFGVSYSGVPTEVTVRGRSVGPCRVSVRTIVPDADPLFTERSLQILESPVQIFDFEPSR